MSKLLKHRPTLAVRVLRASLWASVALNAIGVYVGFVIALFGGVYFWLARQPTVHRPLLVVGGLGKLGFFSLAVASTTVSGA